MLQRLNERKKKRRFTNIMHIYKYIYILQPIIVNNNYREE